MGGLLERAAELEVLRSAVRGARECRGSVVVIAGEMGIGKSGVVRAFVRETETRVLVGHCDDLVTPRAFGALRDAVKGTGGPLERALDSADVFGAVLAELATPTVLVIEDLQWADDATLDVLGYLARRIAELPAVLVLTIGEGPSTERLHRSCSAAAAAPTTQLRLAPLSVNAVSTLAAGSSWNGAELHALTGGIPFYVTETLAARDDVVARVVLARTMRLSDRARNALERLSVVPGPIGLPLAERLLGEDFAALHEAEEHGILEVRHDGLAFRHEVVRRAVESLVPRLRHRFLHRDAHALLSTSDSASSGLTSRQNDVLTLLAEGLTNAEIADRLVLSVRTVDHHVSAVLTKLGVTSRRQAAAIARNRVPSHAC